MEKINEDLMRFLDADEYEDKLSILVEVKGRADEKSVQLMAASLSVAPGGASKEDSIDLIRDHLTMQIKYDGKRMRN